MSAVDRVLMRSEAVQMAADLGTAIHNVISLADQSTDTDKVLAMDTVVLLQTKQNILEYEVMWSKAPKPGKSPAVFTESEGMAQQECRALESAEALKHALGAFAAPGERDYAKSCNDLARAAQLAATELAKAAACYQMSRTVGDASPGRQS